MRQLALAAALAMMVAGPALALEGDPRTFYSNTWICASPEAYATAIERQATWPKDQMAGLKAQLLEERLCMLVVEDETEDMMAPFVEVLETRDNMVRVKFMIEFYRKIEYLHRNITRITYGGWTDEGNLRNYYQWLTGKPPT